MASVLFTHSYFIKLDPKQYKAMKPYAPLGTIYAAAALREGGHEVALHDTMFADSGDQVVSKLDLSPDYLVIYDDSFNWLTKMCLTNMRQEALKMAKFAKDRGITVIVCSSDSTDHYELYLDKGVDFVILGEGEVTLHKILEQNADKDALLNEPGLCFHHNGELAVTGKRAVMRDLDQLPQPAWDLVEIDKYKSAWKSKHGYFSINQVTTRGCPYSCNWCAKPIFGKRYNSRSPKQVVEELALVISEFGAEHVWFCDDIFGLKPQWVQEFKDLVLAQKLKFKYMIQSRVDLLLSEDTAQCLVDSGCDVVWLGVESGSQKILDAMDKGIQVEQVYEARSLMKKIGLKAAFFIQLGYLGEEREDIDLTLKMLQDLLPEEIGVSVAYPLPGTKFYDKVKKDMQNKQNWTDSDDLDLMFQNHFSGPFYKELQRFVHHFYQSKKGIKALKTGLSEPGDTRANLRSAALLPWYLTRRGMHSLNLKRLRQPQEIQ